MEEMWMSVLNEIELEVSKPTFITFFKETRLTKVEDSVATISSPTYITAEYIEKRYYALVKKILDRKLKQNLSLVFASDRKSGKATGSEKLGPLFNSEIVIARPQKIRPQRIRPDYTFESLAVSDSNQLAYTASQTVAKNPGKKYNPFFLYGTVGVGKTHLMHAVANFVIDNRQNCKVLYLTTEEFTNEVVEAIRDKATTSLRKRFRNVDILLLDDVQFLSGKEKVQEELFHTFNALIDAGGQVIFSSDRPPHEIKKIEARLASRFSGGLTVDIQEPDFELRTAILLIKAGKLNVRLSLEAAKEIAQKITDTRALEGFLLRLLSQNKDGEEVSQTFALSVLNSKGPGEQPALLRSDDIIRAVCAFYNIKPTQLKSEKRDSSLVIPRHVCMFLLKESAGITLVEIGNVLGGRDHTTVMYAVEKIKNFLLDKDAPKAKKIKGDILLLNQKIRAGFLQ